MDISHHLHFYLLVLAYCFACTEGLNRRDFPASFVFGAGSSAYQYEGAAYQHGKGSSIWDTFTRMHPEKILGNATGDVAEDFYYRFKEDIALMKEIGLDSFRFSISWSRVLPEGKLSGGVNQDGVEFYNELINELLHNGIQPFVTLFHWDVPQALEDEYGGFLSTNIVDDYGDYANLCFKEFGDRVKKWVTFNEPNTFSSEGYATGNVAPGRCSNYEGTCTAGNSATEPYVVAHHIILSHATAVNLYKNKYQASQMGEIGITVSTFWMVPKYQTVASSMAASRALDFAFGWFVNPITYGDYPESMRALVGNRLPNFTEAQSNMVKGSLDFLGLNYYTARYADDSTSSSSFNLSYTTDSHVDTSRLSDVNNNSLPIEDFLNDSLRLKYLHLHLSTLLKVIKDDGVDVRGYYVWSFLDDFEWEFGYTYRLGINFIDYKNGLRRFMKHSALWFQDFLQNESQTTRQPLLYSH
ncbi:beta-glucosidase 17-like isoform X2 [Corylus avellana]|uniref:beta-glucosidase 17-like isoform X2 n=1 Tax=Corylus avellana TaxID=13451 RepID=UPI00286C33E2|nr:beta-glucosidase 17-like isoform X2 [Corylus avellana]